MKLTNDIRDQAHLSGDDVRKLNFVKILTATSSGNIIDPV